MHFQPKKFTTDKAHSVAAGKTAPETQVQSSP